MAAETADQRFFDSWSNTSQQGELKRRHLGRGTALRASFNFSPRVRLRIQAIARSEHYSALSIPAHRLISKYLNNDLGTALGLYRGQYPRFGVAECDQSQSFQVSLHLSRVFCGLGVLHQ